MLGLPKRKMLEDTSCNGPLKAAEKGKPGNRARTSGQ
jgi:hypothetical protein